MLLEEIKLIKGNFLLVFRIQYSLPLGENTNIMWECLFKNFKNKIYQDLENEK